LKTVAKHNAKILGESILSESQNVEPGEERPRKQAATIYDIAKLSGFNPSTVSRALTTPGRINAKTEAKIRAAAAELNYQVNPFARALPTGRTKMLALIIADITNPVFFNVVRGAESAAALEGYTLVIAESQESSANEAEALNRILPMVDGVMLVTTRLKDEEIQELNRQKPVVLVNRKVPNIADVVPSNQKGIADAIDHLASLGHKHIAFLSGPRASWMNTERWTHLMGQALKAGMTIVEIGPNDPTLEAGRNGLDRIRAAGVSAVVTYNDLMGIGLLREAVAQGIKVPEELSIIGFDNIFGSDFTTPALSTITLDLDRSGRDGVSQLLRLIEGKKSTEKPKVAEPIHEATLLLRSSTAPAGR
jgi:LacI family transcriptional regulator